MDADTATDAAEALLVGQFMLDQMAALAKAGARPAVLIAGVQMALADVGARLMGEARMIEAMRQYADDREALLIADMPPIALH